MSTPLVSVAMPVRNGERYLREAVESILGQTFGDLEFVIVDDASADGTWAILEAYARTDRRVRLLRQEAPDYLGAMNACCQAGTGRYIARMDADDVSFPDRLERQVAFMESRPEVAVLGGDVVLIDDAGKPFGTKGSRRESAALKDKLRTGTCFVHPTTMIRRAVMAQVGWFRPAFAAAQAYDLWLRIAERAELAGLGEPILYRRYHAGQVTFSKMVTQVTCSLAARAAARARREAGRDPLDGARELTPGLLATLGLDPQAISDAVIVRGLAMAKQMVRAGYLDQALSALDETVKRARSGRVHRRGLAKAEKVRALIRWRQGRHGDAAVAVARVCGHYARLAAWRLLSRGGRETAVTESEDDAGG